MPHAAQHLGERTTANGVVREIANRAADRSIALLGPVVDDPDLGLGFLLVLNGAGQPMRAWVEVAGSSVPQLGELGDVIRRTFTTVETYGTNLALAEASLARWPLSMSAQQFVLDQRSRA